MWFRIAFLPLSLLCVILLFPVLSRDIAAQGNPAIEGRWSFLPDLAFFPPHVHVLPTGKVMMWPGDTFGSGNAVHLWDPTTGTTSLLSAPGYDLFCSGHVFLADGRLFAAGGHIEGGVGLPNASTYDPFNDLWTSVPTMNAGRWYPTATVLGNGDVLVVSGAIDNSLGENLLPAVFQVQSDTWRDLTNAQIYLDLYPRMHLAPNGRVFNSAPSTLSRYLDTSGTGTWSEVAAHSVDVYRDYGSSVNYGTGRILVAGGGDPPTNTAEIIDLNAPSPAWRQVPSMAFARRQLNTAILPDGKVFVSGGTSGHGFNNPDTPVFAGEMWNPATETWTTMASAQIPRLYHSALVLLPDARLLSTGGNNYTQTEVYEPPYLFAGPRPTITSTPGSVSHGQTFFVDTTDAASITQVTLLSLSSTTHAVDMNQRFNRLSFSGVAGGLNVVAPSANLAPAGPYMLFILNSSGVPSVAKIVGLTSSAGTGPTLASLSPSSASAGGPAFTLTLNGNNFVSGSVARWNGAARTTTFVSATQLTAAIPATDVATAGNAQVTVMNPGGGTSNALAFTISAFTVSPTLIAAGGTVTATWGGLATPTAADWIALYAAGAPDSAYLDWMYVSCSKTPGSPRANGSCPFTLPSPLPAGAYQLRLFANNSNTVLLISNFFTVSTGTTLSVSPTVIPIGGTVTATWSGITGPSATDWMGLYLPVSGDGSFFDWMYVSCSKTPGSARASGSCPFTVPGTLSPGTYHLRLFADNGFTLLANSNSFTVGASPGTLHFSSATYSAGENGGSATITIMRTGGNSGAVGVTFATNNGTAIAPGDYTAVTQTVSFANADTASKTISIPISDDAVLESDETVNLALTNATGGATLGSPSTAVLTITDDDVAPPGTLQFSAATSSVAENGGSATVTVTRTGGSAGAVGVTFATSNGTATAPADYTAVTQTVSFAAGDTANKTVSVPITNNSVVEPSETVNVALSNATGGASLGSPSTAVLTITDDDSTSPNLSASPTTVSRGSAITAAWSGMPTPAPRDWIGLYTPGAGNGSYIDWIYVSCSKTPGGAGAASGSCPFVVPSTVAVGTYELRFLANDGAMVRAISNSFTVTASGGPTLTETPATIARGGSVTASWSGIAAPTARDWIGLYLPSAANTSFANWIYVSCSTTPGSARASGSCPFSVPTTTAPGTYQLRLLANDGFAVLATSNSFTVQ